MHTGDLPRFYCFTSGDAYKINVVSPCALNIVGTTFEVTMVSM